MTQVFFIRTLSSSGSIQGAKLFSGIKDGDNNLLVDPSVEGGSGYIRERSYSIISVNGDNTPSGLIINSSTGDITYTANPDTLSGSVYIRKHVKNNVNNGTVPTAISSIRLFMYPAASGNIPGNPNPGIIIDESVIGHYNT
jgi:hypothetical protein